MTVGTKQQANLLFTAFLSPIYWLAIDSCVYNFPVICHFLHLSPYMFDLSANMPTIQNFIFF